VITLASGKELEYMYMNVQEITTEIEEINRFLSEKIDRGEFIFNDEIYELLTRLLELVKRVASYKSPELVNKISGILFEIESGKDFD